MKIHSRKEQQEEQFTRMQTDLEAWQEEFQNFQAMVGAFYLVLCSHAAGQHMKISLYLSY